MDPEQTSSKRKPAAPKCSFKAKSVFLLSESNYMGAWGKDEVVILIFEQLNFINLENVHTDLVFW